RGNAAIHELAIHHRDRAAGCGAGAEQSREGNGTYLERGSAGGTAALDPGREINAAEFLFPPVTCERIIPPMIRRNSRWALHLATLVACASSLMIRPADVEPLIQPSVNPILTPTSAIQVPLRFVADQSSVWRSDLDQRMLLTGNVTVYVGYRL